MFIDAREFEDLIFSNPLAQLVEEHILQGAPYVFRGDVDALHLLRSHLVTELGVRPENVLVVGSARTGFSLNPANYPRPFSGESDIDVAVVDQFIFDEAWHTLLKWNYPRRLVKLGKPDGEWAYQRRKDVYWGWFTPNEIRFEGLSFPEVLEPIRDLSTKWFNAFNAFSQYADHPEIARRNVNGRLYRSQAHLFQYHEEGLRLVKQGLERRRAG
jgi:hypothetical protein